MVLGLQMLHQKKNTNFWLVDVFLPLPPTRTTPNDCGDVCQYSTLLSQYFPHVVMILYVEGYDTAQFITKTNKQKKKCTFKLHT